MPPSTRSESKQNSPAASRVSSNGQQTPSKTPSVTPRKAPHCKICKSPMKGHPKGSCPPLDSPTQINDDSSSDNGNEGRPLASAMRSINLGSTTPMRDVDEENKTFVRDRRRKSGRASAIRPIDQVQSLSSTSNDLVERLREPGLLDNTNQISTPVVDWQDVVSPKNTHVRQIMPCSLIPPSAENSFAVMSDSNAVAKAESPTMQIKTSPPSEQEPPVAGPSRSRPLARSMSGEQRDLFLERMSGQAKATIYVVPKDDLVDLQSAASSLKFSTYSLMNNDREDTNAFFIVSTDELAVQQAANWLQEESTTSTKAKKGRTSGGAKIAAVASGAVAGAIGAWAGLAYS
ncbi:hypothetical protein CPB83DRAFT_205231 [Crepidotus variabilis]|uniref:Uncharacterized protein n=1 Tax=Crepidotus variabilis TaxID=179855 RepID=A0A9P6ETI6_9AGAR|nr:hypothetical protein CPB83DRAFT_205231 [Crepidotus variabilis]